MLPLTNLTLPLSYLTKCQNQRISYTPTKPFVSFTVLVLKPSVQGEKEGDWEGGRGGREGGREEGREGGR
jgi:hypothetical protein